MSTPNTIAVNTELVAFRTSEGALEVLLDTQTNEGLPSAALRGEADLDRFAAAQLERACGYRDVYLEQLYSFGRTAAPTYPARVTVTYFALVPPMLSHKVAAGLRWQSAGDCEQLPPEQREALQLAVQRLRDKLGYSTIALPLMPPEFTLGQLQEVYEIIAGEPLDKRNFRKRILAQSCIEETGRQLRNGSHRPAMLYRARNPGRVEILR